MNPGMTGEVVLPRDPSNPVTSRNPSAIQRSLRLAMKRGNPLVLEVTDPRAFGTVISGV